VYAPSAKSLVQEAWAAKVKRPATATTALADRPISACAVQLARFFPDAKAVEVQAILTPVRNGAKLMRESVVVEFASAEKAIFTSALPLEFNDRVHLRQADGRTEREATVVAVQYQDDRKAVAVHFADVQGLWVKKP
jgi:hypothetical protein